MGNDNIKDYPPYLDYPKPRKPVTNYDRLISKSPEELAHVLCLTAKGGIIGQRSETEWLTWLKREEKDGNSRRNP